MIAGFVAATAWGGGGATIAVPGDADSIALALDLASDGDTIAIGPGVWEVPAVVERSVTLLGAGTEATFLGATAVTAYAPLTLEGVRYYGSIYGSAELTLRGVVVDGSYGLYGDAAVASLGPIVLTDVSFAGTFPTGLVLGTGGLVAERVTVSATEARSPLFELWYGDVSATDLTFTSGSAPGTLLSTAGAGTVHLTRLDGCVAGGLSLEAGEIVLDAVHLPLRSYDADIAAGVVLNGAAEVRHATFAVDVEAGGTLALWSSALLGGATVKGATGGGYDLFEGSTVPDVLAVGSVAVDDAGFVAVGGDDGGRCAMQAPGAGSPGVDAGDPATVDRNGTRADIGATGGPDGFVVDVDQDGFGSDVDCADTDGARHPGAQDTPYDGIDQNCDGLDLVDVDGDGTPWPEDCDDDDPALAEDCDPGTPTPGPVDLDGDGAFAGDDCDDADPAVHPGATEDAGPADLDCDGFSDPATPFERRGCDAAAGVGLRGGLAAVAVGLVRRRRVRSAA